MTNVVEIDGKLLSPIKEAALVTDYSRDYITRLAREDKIIASYIGRQWFVDISSLKSYAENISLEQEIRKRHLSEERKRERQLREFTESQRTLHIKKAQSLHTRSLVVASLLLMVGLFSGFATYQLMSSFGVKAGVQTAQVAKQADLQPNTTSAPALPDIENARQVTFRTGSASVEQRLLGDVNTGVLLLPSGGSVSEVETLFSDQVFVRQATDGLSVVVPVDAVGKQLGNGIPFVVVPVNER